MEFLKFLKEVTQELLYNIVYDDSEVKRNDGGIEFRELSQIFEAKYGNRPMDYFGICSEKGWIMFLKSSSGIQFNEGMVTISDETRKSVPFKKFNKTKIHLTNGRNFTVAQYREILIRKACELIYEQTHFVSTEVALDMHGNSALHLIAALPCIGHDPILVKHLLDAGLDPLKKNCAHQTILHIIAGRMQAKVCKNNDDVDIDCGSFGSSKFDSTTWPANDRLALFQYLSEQQFTVLANAANRNGNTAMHEWVISLSTIDPGCLQLGFDEAEKELGLKLLSFDADLRRPNNSCETPLHLAYNSEIFQFLLDHVGAQKAVVCCRARNEREETPLLRLVKYATSLVSCSSNKEKNMIALFTLREVVQIVTNNDAVCKTGWMLDEDGNSVVAIILTAVKKTSRPWSPTASMWNVLLNLFRSSPQKNETLSEIRKLLINLLQRSLRVASLNDIKQLSLLNVFLDLGDIDDEELLQCVELLLKNGVEVNKIDLKGRTSLDVVNDCKSKMPSNPFFSKCEKKLRRYEAKSGSFFRSSLQEQTSGPKVDNRERKILSCPEKHSHCAQLLIKNNDKATVVNEKYRYSSKDPIGSGAFSSIFVAVKDDNEGQSGTIICRPYAMKRIEKARTNSNELEREIMTLCFLLGKHENIINYHDSFDDDNFHYLFLDLMDGDLNEFVTNKEVTKEWKYPAIHVKVTKQIIDGVAYLHQQKLMHRDLKPGNILYTFHPELNFKIADFGLTKNLSTMTSTRLSSVTMAPGTRCWMAPELINDKPEQHSQQSDIFSLGLVLHFLITLGKHPFAEKNEEPPHVIEKRIIDAQIKIDPTLHPEAISFFKETLKDSLMRPSAKKLKLFPFLWSERKKVEFLKAVGDQPEAAKPNNNRDSRLEKSLQMTRISQNIPPWNIVNCHIEALFAELTAAYGKKKYRCEKVIDLLRFIRNAYAHNEVRLLKLRDKLHENVFLFSYPSLVVDVLDVVRDLGFLRDENRRNIQEALTVLA